MPKKNIVDEIYFFNEYAALKAGRSSGWLSAVNIVYLLEAIIKNTGEVLPCSAIDGEGVSIGRAVRLSRQGIEQVISIEMDDEEQKQWQKARGKIVGILKELESSI